MILVPKRKIVSGIEQIDQVSETIIKHTSEIVTNEIRTGYFSYTTVATYDKAFQIPTGTNKYPG